jgi:hypothetical protein
MRFLTSANTWHFQPETLHSHCVSYLTRQTSLSRQNIPLGCLSCMTCNPEHWPYLEPQVSYWRFRVWNSLKGEYCAALPWRQMMSSDSTVFQHSYIISQDRTRSSQKDNIQSQHHGLFSVTERFVIWHISINCDVELRHSPSWVGGNIGITDATKTCHILNAYIFKTNNRKVIDDTSLDSV